MEICQLAVPQLYVSSGTQLKVAKLIEINHFVWRQSHYLYIPSVNRFVWDILTAIDF